MEYSESDLTSVDPLDHIRANPRVYLPDGHVDPATLVARLVSDILQLEECVVTALRVHGWWIVASGTDWIASDAGVVPHDYFHRIVPFPEAGQNAFHTDVLVTAFARDVVTADRESEKVIKGTHAEGDPPFQLARNNTQWARMLGFRMAPEE